MKSRMAVTMGAVLMLACLAMSTAVTAAPIANDPAVGEIVLPGRVTQSEGDGGEMAIGSVFNVASWDGQLLGTQWMMACGAQAVPAETKIALDGKGNGFVYTETAFEKGYFVLSKYGPWVSRGEDLVGPLRISQIAVTENMVENVCVRVDYEMTATGRDQFGRTVNFTIQHCLDWGETEDGSLPKAYPQFLDQNCAAGRIAGYWWELDHIHIDVTGSAGPREPRRETDLTLQSGVRTGSWGALKVIYR